MISSGPARVLTGRGAHLVAELNFDSMVDIDAALASPEGQAAAADLVNFADGGASIFVFETASV